MAKTMKELNARVEELAAEFRDGLSKFSDQLSDLNFTPDDPQKAQGIISKFKEFENAMNDSLEAVRNDCHVLHNKLELVENKCEQNVLWINNKYIILHGLEENSDLEHL